jgi:hypothetical protein
MGGQMPAVLPATAQAPSAPLPVANTPNLADVYNNSPYNAPDATMMVGEQNPVSYDSTQELDANLYYGQESPGMGGYTPTNPAAPPQVNPNFTGTLFEGSDTPTGEQYAKVQPEPVAPPPAVEPKQSQLFTAKGEPTSEVKKAVLFGATKIKPGTPEAKILLHMVRGTSGQVTEEAAGKLGSADGVLLGREINEIKRGTLFTQKAKSVIRIKFSVGKSNYELAYDEGKYGAPVNFAAAMGIDYALFDTGMYQRAKKDGSTTEFKYLSDGYTTAEMDKLQQKLQADAAKGTTDAVQEPAPTGVDVPEQTGTGKRVRKKNTAGANLPLVQKAQH